MTTLQEDTKVQGKVKFFNKKRGYGFIVSENINEDIFFHFTSMDNNQNEIFLETDTRLVFDVFKGSKGVHAKNISCVENQNNNESVNYKKFLICLGGIINEEIKKNKEKIH